MFYSIFGNKLLLRVINRCHINFNYGNRTKINIITKCYLSSNLRGGWGFLVYICNSSVKSSEFPTLILNGV